MNIDTRCPAGFVFAGNIAASTESEAHGAALRWYGLRAVIRPGLWLAVSGGKGNGGPKATTGGFTAYLPGPELLAAWAARRERKRERMAS